MNYMVITKQSKKYGFKKGDKYPLERNLHNECTITTPNGVITLNDNTVKRYGIIQKEK